MEKANEKKQETYAAALEKIEEEIKQIEYGSVTAVIQDGKVIQIDTNKKTRLI